MGLSIELESQKSLLRALCEQAQSIHQLVSHLLEIARLQSDSVELNLAWQPVEEVLAVAQKQASDLTRQRQVDVEIEAGLPPLRIDAVLIERVLWNLIENACKYSPERSPLRTSASRHDDYVVVAIADCCAGFGLAIARTTVDCWRGIAMAAAVST